MTALAVAAPAHAQVTERQLTFDTFTDDAPAWQPTDSLIVFESQRTGNLDLFKVKTTPSTEIQITLNVKADQSADWSPDGLNLVYSAVANAGLDLWVRPVAGGPAVLLHQDSTAADRYPSWSPDGATIAFESNGDVFLLPAAGGTPTQLTTHAAFDGHPSWSPDGSRIVFQSSRSGNSDLWVIPSGGGTATQVTADPSNESAPDWSPIGDLIVFHTDRSGFGNIWVVPAAGGTQTQITSNAFGDDFRPDWSPHGDEIAFARAGSIWLAAFAVTGISVGAGVTPSAPAEGDSVAYTITASNAGPHDATGVEVTDVLPAGVTLVSASATQGAWAAGTGVWTVGALPVSAAETLTLVATVDPGTGGTLIDNTALLTAADSLDADTADDSATATIAVAAMDLAVTKTVDDAAPSPGGTIVYTIALANVGAGAATGVVVSDALPAGLTYDSDTVTQGSYASGTGLWTVGTVAAGGADTLWIAATVDAGAAGQMITNTAFVSAADQADPDGGNDSSSVVVTVAAGATSAGGGPTVQGFALLPPSPNPFHRHTTIRLAIAEPGPISLAVFDVRGREVRDLVHRPLPAGETVADWDGLDDLGHRVPAGVYFLCLRSGGLERTRKVVRLD